MFLGADFDVAQVRTRRALVCLDLQNDFITREGKLPVQNSEHIISNVAELVSVFRQDGDVVWVSTEFGGVRDSVSRDTGSYVVILPRFILPAIAGNDDNSTPAPSSAPSEAVEKLQAGDDEGFLSNDLPPHRRCCVPGTSGCDLPEALNASLNGTEDGFITKSDYSAFSSTPLLMTLRSKLVTEVYVVGSLSNISAYATAIDAIRHGFKVTLVEDCLGYRTIECHEEALRQMTEMLGAESITSTEFIAFVQEATQKASDAAKKKKKQKKKKKTQRPPVPGSSLKGESEDLALRPKIEDWMKGIPKGSTSDLALDISKGSDTPFSPADAPDTVHVNVDNHVEPRLKSRSPPRKRSTGDRDAQLTKENATGAIHLYREASRDTDQSEESHADEHPPRRRRTVKEANSEDTLPTLQEQNQSSVQDAASSLNVEVENIRISDHSVSPTPRKVSRLNSIEDTEHSLSGRPKPLQEKLGEGDSYVLSDVIPENKLSDLFEDLKAEIGWQKMYHRSGEVPRLVAVQGAIQPDGSAPIYRHPADESPPLLPFSSKVQMIKREVEKTTCQSFNHVLIQLYRTGEDSISEHSDKTLDIIRGSDIVNFSIGAQRTMILRTKASSQCNLLAKISKPLSAEGSDVVAETSAARRLSDVRRSALASPVSAGIGPRKIQRVPLPHNSLFVLGAATNTSWLHAIRADKRRSVEKTPEELAFGGERISLTFRRIGTFVTTQYSETKQISRSRENPVHRATYIWGQGATNKAREQAQKVVVNEPKEVERLIQAFGEENHQSGHDFAWDKTYGGGFDVVNFTVKNGQGAAVAGVSMEADVSLGAKLAATEEGSG